MRRFSNSSQPVRWPAPSADDSPGRSRGRDFVSGERCRRDGDGHRDCDRRRQIPGRSAAIGIYFCTETIVSIRLRMRRNAPCRRLLRTINGTCPQTADCGSSCTDTPPTAPDCGKPWKPSAEPGVSIDVRVTWEAGDAARFAKEAVEKSLTSWSRAGGDGTLNEVVNGMLAVGFSAANRLGRFALGDGERFRVGLRFGRCDAFGSLETRRRGPGAADGCGTDERTAFHQRRSAADSGRKSRRTRPAR